MAGSRVDRARSNDAAGDGPPHPYPRAVGRGPPLAEAATVSGGAWDGNGKWRTGRGWGGDKRKRGGGEEAGLQGASKREMGGTTRGLPRGSPILVLLSPKHA